jgi:hypothetical protein
MKFDIRTFFENLSGKFMFDYNFARVMGSSRED